MITANIKGEYVTLLTGAAARKLPVSIRAIGKWYWLSTPCKNCYEVETVRSDGSIKPEVVDTVRSLGPYDAGVRPVLKVKDSLKDLGLTFGTEVEHAGFTWIVISDDELLSKDLIGSSVFRHFTTVSDSYELTGIPQYFCTGDRKRYPASELNSYDRSDVSAFLEDWALQHRVIKPGRFVEYKEPIPEANNKNLIGESKAGVIYHLKEIPTSMFEFFIHKRKEFKNGTASYCIGVSPTFGNKYNSFIIETVHGTLEDAKKKLDEFLEKYQNPSIAS